MGVTLRFADRAGKRYQTTGPAECLTKFMHGGDIAPRRAILVGLLDVPERTLSEGRDSLRERGGRIGLVSQAGCHGSAREYRPD
jgi:hypothetical protein